MRFFITSTKVTEGDSVTFQSSSVFFGVFLSTIFCLTTGCGKPNTESALVTNNLGEELSIESRMTGDSELSTSARVTVDAAGKIVSINPVATGLKVSTPKTIKYLVSYLPYLNAKTSKKVTLQNSSEVKLIGTGIYRTDDTYLGSVAGLSTLTSPQFTTLVSVANQLLNKFQASNPGFIVGSQNRFGDKLTGAIVSALSIQKIVVSNATIESAMGILRTDNVQLEVTASVQSTLSQIANEIFEAFERMSNSHDGGYYAQTYNGFGGYSEMHELKAGDPDSGDIRNASGEEIGDTDKNDDGKEDDNSAWDNFIDWLYGEDVEGDGITYESEGGWAFQSKVLYGEVFNSTYGEIVRSAVTDYASGLIDSTALSSKIRTLVNVSNLNAAVKARLVDMGYQTNAQKQDFTWTAITAVNMKQ